jgi:hypothetical protein
MATRVAGAYGLDIFDVELKREGGQQVLRVIVDRPGPASKPEESVSIEDCARVAEELSTMLDVGVIPRLHLRSVVAGTGSAAAQRRRLPAVRRPLGKVVTSQPVGRGRRSRDG